MRYVLGTMTDVVLNSGQKIPIHGDEPAEESCRTKGQNARHSEDSGYCTVLEDEKGQFSQSALYRKRLMPFTG